MGGRRGGVLAIDGERCSGQEVRSQNVTACVAIANAVKSSLGPDGLDKMIVDDVGDVLISNDGATILHKLEVEHPAAKCLVQLANLQDQEVGDGTTSVVIIAAELLKRANVLIQHNIHPTSLIAGYRLACREACKYIKDHLTVKVDTLAREVLVNAATTTLSSKIIGSYGTFFPEMIVDAVTRVKNVSAKGKTIYPIKAVNVLKAHGRSAKESEFVPGFALNCTIASQAMPKRAANAKIACIDFNLNKTRMQQGVNIVITDPEKLQEVQDHEIGMTKARIQKIIDAGATVILTTKAMDDLAQKYLVKAGIMGVRRVAKKDLKYIARATGATFVLTMAGMEGEEEFDPSWLGEAELVEQVSLSDNELIHVKGCKSASTSSIILRGANDTMLDEMERSVHDAICVVKRVLESNSVVPGGGCVEAALSVYLRNFAHTLGSREQLAISQFAEALLVIPKTLCINAAQDATELTAKLIAHHHKSQKDESKKYLAVSGLDLTNGKIRNNFDAGVLEPAMSKVKTLQFATEAAISVLRIDDLITLNPEPEQRGHGH
mmetsp:Transcript_1407/g.3765  ORF Transcript_1407/g.3765 Transcript_1407/m.3765 type:complete len:549 (+) Transcript_1407:2-1648(+)